MLMCMRVSAHDVVNTSLLLLSMADVDCFVCERLCSEQCLVCSACQCTRNMESE